MSRPQREYGPDARTRAVEMLVFVVVSAIGIYAVGRGLSGLFEAGQGINLPWLAIAAVAIWILVTQMGRVNDAWPRRKDSDGQVSRPGTREDADSIAPLASAGGDGESRR